jgi:hypothetical protein
MRDCRQFWFARRVKILWEKIVFWVAVLILCTPQTCFSVGSPIFASEQECHSLTVAQGIPTVSAQQPTAQIMGYKCVPFGKRSA